MIYLIPSIGRCGSTHFTYWVGEAAGMEVRFSMDPHRHFTDGMVNKTHWHYQGPYPFEEWKAIYIWGHVGDSIASIHSGRVKTLAHFRNLMVVNDHLIEFERLRQKASKEDAFLWMIEGDKFRFKENYRSWKLAPNTIFVKYEEFVGGPDWVRRQLSNFLGLEFPGTEVKQRASNWQNLSGKLQGAIIKEYEKSELLF